MPRRTWAWGGGRPPASERITIGVIGWGMMGPVQHQGLSRRVRLPGGGRLRSRQQAPSGSSRHHQRAIRQQGLQRLSRLPRAAGARRYRRGDDRHSRSLARDRGHRSGQPQKGHLRREAAGAHHRRAAGHRESRREEQHHLADRFVAAFAWRRFTKPPRSSATASSARSRTWKSACPKAITISRQRSGACSAGRPGGSARCDQLPGSDSSRHQGLGLSPSPSLPRGSTTTPGSALRRWSRTSSSGSTRTGAGTTTPAPAS